MIVPADPVHSSDGTGTDDADGDGDGDGENAIDDEPVINADGSISEAPKRRRRRGRRGGRRGRGSRPQSGDAPPAE